MPRAARAGLFCFALSLSACFHTRFDPSVAHGLAIRSPEFAAEIAAKTSAPWLGGNAIRTLPNGDAFFPPMLKAMRSARHSISFETFAFVDAPVTRQFATALAERARAGVAVKLILDATGSAKAGQANLQLMREAGVALHLYHPFRPWQPRLANNRTHRKILIVDGKVAFTGGAGFAHAWSGDAQSPDHWRDTQYEVRGPAVREFQRAFADNWQEVSGETLTGSSFFPPLRAEGRTKVQVVWDDPWGEDQAIAHGFAGAINGARQSLLLQQSYFIPNARFRTLLIAAARRGVKIEIMVPNHLVDSKPTRYASQNHWAELLRAGIRLYQYETTMMHGKLLVADGQFSIVGSANFDDRSFFINDEMSLHVDSAEFAREQTAMFRRDLQVCHEVTLATLPGVLEPSYQRFFARLIESQL